MPLGEKVGFELFNGMWECLNVRGALYNCLTSAFKIIVVF